METDRHENWGINMKTILTSHVGSLPRTQEVVDFIFARENNEAFEETAFDACMRDACAETVFEVVQENKRKSRKSQTTVSS